MTERWLPRLAWALAALAVALDVLASWFNLRLPPGASPTIGPGESIGYVVAWVTFVVVGALIVSRHPRHRIGWICVAIGVLASSLALAGGYSAYALALDPTSPSGIFATWFWGSLFFALLGLLTLLLLLFPDGHVPSPRWRVVAIAAVLSALVATVGSAVAPVDIQGSPGTPNPYAVRGPLAGVVIALGAVVFAVSVAAFIAAAISLVRRLRASSGDERRQLLWIALAGSSVAVVLALLPIDSPDLLRGQVSPLHHLLFSLSLAATAIAIGIAVLRYRLYAIDVLVYRAFVYGALTAILAGLYAATIRLFQAMFVEATGDESDAALVITTLILATSFTPIKRRLETFVDRRFKTGAAHATAASGQMVVSDGNDASVRLERIEAELASLRNVLAAAGVSERAAENTAIRR
jgi:hypothetical protein